MFKFKITENAFFYRKNIGALMTFETIIMTPCPFANLPYKHWDHDPAPQKGEDMDKPCHQNQYKYWM